MTRIAYLTSLYPAPSHTFIRREIAALREAGLDIRPFSISPAKGQPTSPLESEMLEETQAVLGRSPGQYIAAFLGAFVTQPARAFATFRLAMRHRVPGIRAMIWALFHLVEAFLLARLLQRQGINRLHNHFANSGATVGMLAAHFNAIPWSFMIHGVSETDYPAGLLLGEKIARADFACCASYFMRAQAMRAAAPEYWSRLHIVRCGIDRSMLSAPMSDSMRTGGIRFICVGRLSAEKGHRGLLDAFVHVLDRMPNAQLNLVGYGPLQDELMAVVQDRGISGSVIFHGMLDEAATLKAIAASDILVLPSFMEGLPVVLMEAMASGKAVISSGVAGVPELVQNGVNGLLFPPSHWEALADAMILLAEDEGLRLKFGKAGQEAVMQEFVIDKAVRPLLALFPKTTG